MMKFHLEFTPQPFSIKIKHTDKLLLMGSCFTENIGSKFKAHKFDVLENPNGILFNPVSICQSIFSYIENKQYGFDELFYANECWHSWQYHSRYSHTDKVKCLEFINRMQKQAHDFLHCANWIFITLGSAFVYETRANGAVVANCHKLPADTFNRRLLRPEEVQSTLEQCINELRKFNPSVKIIFTISPVRHLREGFVENNRSKSLLIQAVHELLEKYDQVFYFPAYELVLDDLRDYRFYAEDMVHPNYAATNYVWDKLMDCCIGEETKKIMQAINVINAAIHHKPFNPTSGQHKKFLEEHFKKTEQLQTQLPYLDFSGELEYFSATL